MITRLHPGPALAPASQNLPHVLLVVDQLGKSLGGGERVALKTAGLLPQFGYRASVLTFFVHPESTALHSSQAPIYLLPLERTYDLRAFRGAASLGRFVDEHRVNIVQTFFESSDLWAGSVTKAITDAKLIWSRRDMGILRTSKHHYAYRILAELPDAVFAVSEQVRQYCIQTDGIPPERIRTIYNGLDLTSWPPRLPCSGPGNSIQVTTVGNIRHVKGHDILIRAAAIVLQEFPEVTFKVVGEPLEDEYFQSLRGLVEELHLTDRFVFAGGSQSVREQLAESNIFVLPSRSEGFSNAIIEAMAAALPVVATDVGGNAEAVVSGVSGFLVPPEDPPALASALMKLIAAPELRARLGMAGREIAERRFSNDAMMRNTVAVYDQLRGIT
jgi:glycosyltransferase involved in cell wall biosynthesis